MQYDGDEAAPAGDALLNGDGYAQQVLCVAPNGDNHVGEAPAGDAVLDDAGEAISVEDIAPVDAAEPLPAVNAVLDGIGQEIPLEDVAAVDAVPGHVVLMLEYGKVQMALHHEQCQVRRAENFPVFVVFPERLGLPQVEVFPVREVPD